MASAKQSPTAATGRSAAPNSGTALASFGARTRRSWKIAQDRAQVLPETTNVAGDRGLHLYVSGAAEGHLIDVDGNRYVDLCMGYGAHVLGHNHASVRAAILTQAARGWHYGLAGEGQLAFAHLVQAAGAANERVLLCNTGSEATQYAIRAARAFTGRDVIAVFTGSFHGAHDYGLIGGDAEGTAPPRKIHVGAGVPDAVDETITVLPYGEDRALEDIQRLRHRLAAVIVEPVQGGWPVLTHGNWLHKLERACRDASVLLIFDEVLTGFRLAYGGAQEFFGVAPDLVAYGKAAGGGLPIGIVAGRATVMDVFAGIPAEKGIFHGGTFAGNPLSVAAGMAALGHMLAHRSEIYPMLNAAGAKLADGFNTAASQRNVPVRIQAAGSIFRFVFGSSDAAPRIGRPSPFAEAEAAFYTEVLSRGVLVHASQRCFLSAAHTAADLETMLNAFIEGLDAVIADGFPRRGH